MMTTPRGERPHISIFGRTNVGKSTLANAITNQSISLVSHVAGTTTDPVYKAMELLPIGPIVIIDTAGYDDTSELGALRVEKTSDVIEKTDLAIIVIDTEQQITSYDANIIKKLKNKNIKTFCVINKKNATDLDISQLKKEYDIPFIQANILHGADTVKEMIIQTFDAKSQNKTIVGDFIDNGDIVVLVIPVDKSAPKGRLILPQQQTIRDILEHKAIAVISQETELAATLSTLAGKVKMVITDAQIFGMVKKIVPEDILLTSFSVLFANYKGELRYLAEGANKINDLKPNDKVLICEACTHHRQDGDIGKDKIPKLLESKAGGKLDFTWYSGTDFPKNDELCAFNLIVHCGACMINEKEMLSRIERAVNFNIPIVNYGVLFAFFAGSLERTLEPMKLSI